LRRGRLQIAAIENDARQENLRPAVTQAIEPERLRIARQHDERKENVLP
jgi:hypothetical protein